MNPLYFECSHDVLVQNWNQDGYQDYELTSISGDCGRCGLTKEDLKQTFESDKVLTQIGAARFGVKTGFCVCCIAQGFPRNLTLGLEFGFKDSADIHVIRVDRETLENFLNQPNSEASLSQEDITYLIEALERNKNNPDLAKAAEYKKMSHQCKDCFGYILDVVNEEFNQFATLCNTRDNDNYVASCFGCSGLMGRVSGCSILTCPNRLCVSKICAFCLNGASSSRELQHDIKVCTRKIDNREAPPIPRLCECVHEQPAAL